MLRYFTAGESHGEALVAFLSGMPAGLKVDQTFVDRELWRRQQGYGRGGRMKIERDTAHILSGVRHGITIGSPISLELANRDWKNWEESSRSKPEMPANTSVSPHLDPAMPISLELSNTTFPKLVTFLSARRQGSPQHESPSALLQSCCLRELGIEVLSHVVTTGGVTLSEHVPWEKIRALCNREEVLLNCANPELEQQMKEEVDRVLKTGDSLGGVFEVVAHRFLRA